DPPTGDAHRSRSGVFQGGTSEVQLVRVCGQVVRRGIQGAASRSDAGGPYGHVQRIDHPGFPVPWLGDACCDLSAAGADLGHSDIRVSARVDRPPALGIYPHLPADARTGHVIARLPYRTAPCEAPVTEHESHE